MKDREARESIERLEATITKLESKIYELDASRYYYRPDLFVFLNSPLGSRGEKFDASNINTRFNEIYKFLGVNREFQQSKTLLKKSK